jgi:hypothetical protein
MGGACSLNTQNCPDAGACDFVQGTSGIETACTPSGSRGLGETCGGANGDCQPGYICAGPQGGTQTCLKMCFLNPGECPTGYACTGGVQISQTPFYAVGTCAPQCGLLAQDCPNNLACYPSTQGNVCYTAGAGGSGATCTGADQCQKGYGCFQNGASGACRHFCNTDGGMPGCTGSLPDGGANSCLPTQAGGEVGACAQ